MRKLVGIAILAAVPCLAQKIAGGPLVVNVGQRNATVVWIVQDGQASLQGPSGTASQPVLRAVSSTFTNLQPGGKYDVTVAGGEKVSFKTAPANNLSSFRFLLFGDTRTRLDVHKKVVAQILKQGVPDFIAFSGDAAEDGRDAQLWSQFFDAERDLLRQAAIFPSLGNHEHHSKSYFDYFQQAKPYYSFDWGTAHFSVLDSDLEDVGNQAERDAYWSAQTKWLEEDLKTHQASGFRFVMAHHPPYTAVTRRQGDNPHMTALVPMFEKYNVNAALFGHDHTYQHYLSAGIHYVVSGGGGAPLYDVDKPPQGITVKVASIENFLEASVNGETAHFKAIDINGVTLDEFDVAGTVPTGR